MRATTLAFLCMIGFEAWADSVKLTILNNVSHEERVFRFAETNKMYPIDLKSKFSTCTLNYKQDEKGISTVEVGCSPVGGAKGPKDRFRAYSTRAKCFPGSPATNFLIYDSDLKDEKSFNAYTLMIQCE